MFREDLAWEMIRRVYNGNDKGLTPLEKIEYDRQRTDYLKDVAEGHQYQYYVPTDLPMHGIEFSYLDRKRGFTREELCELADVAETIAKWTEKYARCENGYFTIERYDEPEKTLKISGNHMIFSAFGSGLRDLQYTRLTVGIVSMVMNNYNDTGKYHQARLEAAICFALTIRAAREMGFKPSFSDDIDFGKGILENVEEIVRIATEAERELKETDIYHLIRYPDYVDPDTHVVDAEAMMKNTENSEAVRKLTDWWNKNCLDRVSGSKK